jgi:septum formation protein
VEERCEGDPAEVVLENALAKARAGLDEGLGAAWVLGADTDVALDGRLLGKPEDEAGARERLATLAGRTHEVLGAVALLDGRDPGAEPRSAVVSTRVTFADLGEAETDAYIRSGEWQDRAGAYAVQGLGAGFVVAVEGDLANVIGLPLRALRDLAPQLF